MASVDDAFGEGNEEDENWCAKYCRIPRADAVTVAPTCGISKKSAGSGDDLNVVSRPITRRPTTSIC